ncbi:Error-prone DNA polymerase [Frankliniella fusca]|uniref:Error-prone DNA polymerase n=1 Tax=Frankliniella fusca TaxID=407009 RepID=A0AAE1LDI1_9NEOP|nr:Error-prone DNA polymerase [Frankliniella fusca]
MKTSTSGFPQRAVLRASQHFFAGRGAGIQYRDEEAEGVVGGAALARDVVAELLPGPQRVEHGLVQQLHQQLRHAALDHGGAAALVVVDGAAVLVVLVEGPHPAAPLAKWHLRGALVLGLTQREVGPLLRVLRLTCSSRDMRSSLASLVGLTKVLWYRRRRLSCMAANSAPSTCSATRASCAKMASSSSGSFWLAAYKGTAGWKKRCGVFYFTAYRAENIFFAFGKDGNAGHFLLVLRSAQIEQHSVLQGLDGQRRHQLEVEEGDGQLERVIPPVPDLEDAVVQDTRRVLGRGLAVERQRREVCRQKPAARKKRPCGLAPRHESIQALGMSRTLYGVRNQGSTRSKAAPPRARLDMNMTFTVSGRSWSTKSCTACGTLL